MLKITKILLIAATILFCFELFLRITPWGSGLSPVTYDKEIGMWHKKNFSTYQKRSCYKVRFSYDKEGRPRSIQPYDPEKKDIILLGDSFIEANMIAAENQIHNYLGTILKNNFNMLNYGLSGTAPTQQLEILKHKTSLKNTTAVILYTNPENDLRDAVGSGLDITSRPKVQLHFTSLNDYTVQKPAPNTWREKARDAFAGLELYPFLKRTYYTVRNHFQKAIPTHVKTTTPQKGKESPAQKQAWLNIQGSIFQMNALCKKAGVEFYCVVYSSNPESTKKLCSFLKEQSIPYTSIAQKMKEISKETPLIFSCDSHWNDQGHIVAATLTAKAFF
jgi:hypothetical protein